MNKSFSIHWIQSVMKDSAEPDLPIQKKFNFIPTPVIKKLINFQIRKKK